MSTAYEHTASSAASARKYAALVLNNMPLDAGGQQHVPQSGTTGQLQGDEGLFVVRYTGEAFREYECVARTKPACVRLCEMPRTISRRSGDLTESLLLVQFQCCVDPRFAEGCAGDPQFTRPCRQYLAAITRYRQRVWTCARTRASGLTYEEALSSEANLKPKVRDVFESAHDVGPLRLCPPPSHLFASQQRQKPR